MNWERVKNFLIFLFIGINIFLAAFMLSSVRTTTSVTEDVIDDTVRLLAVNGVTADSSIIPISVKSPGTFDVMPIQVNSTYQPSKTLTSANVEGEIKKALKALGIKDFEITKNEDIYTATQKVGGYFIYDSAVTATVSANEITLSGVWYKQQTKPNKKDGDVLPVTAVLIDFMNNPDRTVAENEITSIEIGYCVPRYDSGAEHKSMPSVPGYAITTANGKTFIYDATGGSYIASK